MTTLDEISQCPVANREFWSARARFNLACYRYIGTGPLDRGVARAAFRKNMAYRRAQMYLVVPV